MTKCVFQPLPRSHNAQYEISTAPLIASIDGLRRLVPTQRYAVLLGRNSAIFSPSRWAADLLGGLALEAVRIPLLCNNPATAHAV